MTSYRVVDSIIQLRENSLYIILLEGCDFSKTKVKTVLEKAFEALVPFPLLPTFLISEI